MGAVRHNDNLAGSASYLRAAHTGTSGAAGRSWTYRGTWASGRTRGAGTSRGGHPNYQCDRHHHYHQGRCGSYGKAVHRRSGSANAVDDNALGR